MEIELLEKPTTELTVTARAALALSSEQTRKDLKELVAKSANIREVKNAAGRDECHGAAMALVRARTTITKTGKAAREDAAAFQKAVIAEEKSLIAITEGDVQTDAVTLFKDVIRTWRRLLSGWGLIEDPTMGVWEAMQEGKDEFGDPLPE